MSSQTLPLLLVALGILGAACSQTGASVDKAAGAMIADIASASDALDSSCQTTQPPDPPFIPPAPWPSKPPGEGQFWIGDDGLWTAVPANGSWPQLALGEKFWWWSEKFEVSEDSTPDIIVTARRLDGNAPVLNETDATNGYHESFNWAMLVGVELASGGCWEITGEYKGHDLSLIIWVPDQ